MSERRASIRTAMNAQVMVWHPSLGEKLFNTRDVSDGGIFVVVQEGDFPPIGSVVEIQVQGLPAPAPILKMEVVRSSPDGFGLQFV
ncbi:PilZ domain-containing protein [Marinobacteraceae bacterium S3BR75-40.1]